MRVFANYFQKEAKVKIKKLRVIIKKLRVNQKG